MMQISSIERLRDVIVDGLALVYVSHPGCSVCHGLKPQIDELLTSFPDVRTYEIDSAEVPEVASELSVLTVPVVLLFADGKEVLRRARFVPIAELRHQLERITEAWTA